MRPRGQILTGRSLEESLGRLVFHHCGFNASAAICVRGLIYGTEAELSREPMRPSRDSWKPTRASSVPVPLPARGCPWHTSLPVPTSPRTGSPGQPNTGRAGPTAPSPACTLSPTHPPHHPPCGAAEPPGARRARGTSVGQEKIQPVLI